MLQQMLFDFLALGVASRVPVPICTKRQGFGRAPVGSIPETGRSRGMAQTARDVESKQAALRAARRSSGWGSGRALLHTLMQHDAGFEGQRRQGGERGRREARSAAVANNSSGWATSETSFCTHYRTRWCQVANRLAFSAALCGCVVAPDLAFEHAVSQTQCALDLSASP